MQSLINLDDVNTKIITIRNQSVILDSDVATLYGVETRRINEAVKRNPEKFPEGYVFHLKINEYDGLQALFEKSQRADNQDAVAICDRILKTNQLTIDLGKTTVLPKAFTEKGLYMLATILKSPQAIQATIAIVETFAKLKQLSNDIAYLNSVEPEIIEPEVIERTGGLLNDLLLSAFPQGKTKTSAELNLGILKIKREITDDPRHNTIEHKVDELKQLILEMKNQEKT